MSFPQDIEEPDEATVRAATLEWLDKAVIGLNLCPFAKSVRVKNQVRVVVSDAKCTEALLENLLIELKYLAEADPAQTDTTLLVHPFVLQDFLDFNDFLDIAENALEALELEGILQIASFHPDYVFAGTDSEDMGNYSNRSPYPTLHLIRESSIDRAVAAFPDADTIWQRNIEVLDELGLEGWREMFAKK